MRKYGGAPKHFLAINSLPQKSVLGPAECFETRDYFFAGVARLTLSPCICTYFYICSLQPYILHRTLRTILCLGIARLERWREAPKPLSRIYHLSFACDGLPTDRCHFAAFTVISIFKYISFGATSFSEALRSQRFFFTRF